MKSRQSTINKVNKIRKQINDIRGGKLMKSASSEAKVKAINKLESSIRKWQH
jgi:glycerate-2-kinase